MSLTELTLADIKKLEKILSRKAKLESEISQINSTLASFTTSGAGAKPGRRRGRKPGRKPGRKAAVAKGEEAVKSTGRHGALKSKILSALKKSGDSGIHIKALAKKLKAKELNIRAWFATTGKKVPGIVKVSPARYALKS